jgi:hypothetical protein
LNLLSLALKHLKKETSEIKGYFLIQKLNILLKRYFYFIYRELIEDFLNVLYETHSDFTNSFRRLSELKLTGVDSIQKDIEDFIPIILEECSTIQELKSLFKPKIAKE